MTSLLLAFLAMLTLGYFVSRGLLRTAFFARTVSGLAMAHAATAAILFVVVLFIKLPLGGYNRAALLPTIAAQIALFAMDRVRNRLPEPRR